MHTAVEAAAGDRDIGAAGRIAIPINHRNLQRSAPNELQVDNLRLGRVGHCDLRVSAEIFFVVMCQKVGNRCVGAPTKTGAQLDLPTCYPVERDRRSLHQMRQVTTAAARLTKMIAAFPKRNNGITGRDRLPVRIEHSHGEVRCGWQLKVQRRLRIRARVHRCVRFDEERRIRVETFDAHRPGWDTAETVRARCVRVGPLLFGRRDNRPTLVLHNLGAQANKGVRHGVAPGRLNRSIDRSERLQTHLDLIRLRACRSKTRVGRVAKRHVLRLSPPVARGVIRSDQVRASHRQAFEAERSIGIRRIRRDQRRGGIIAEELHLSARNTFSGFRPDDPARDRAGRMQTQWLRKRQGRAIGWHGDTDERRAMKRGGGKQAPGSGCQVGERE